MRRHVARTLTHTFVLSAIFSLAQQNPMCAFDGRDGALKPCNGFYYMVLDNMRPGEYTLEGWTEGIRGYACCRVNTQLN